MIMGWVAPPVPFPTAFAPFWRHHWYLCLPSKLVLTGVSCNREFLLFLDVKTTAGLMEANYT